MADHFYSFPTAGTTTQRKRSDITVGTSSTAGNPIEIRVTDGTLTARQVYDALEFLADLAAARDLQVIPGGTLL
jgi:hypothetical protein